MAKYVCNFDEVAKQAGVIITAGADMNNSLKTCTTNVAQHLTSWKSSSARPAFDSVNNEQVTTTTNHVNDITEVGNFIKKAGETILQVEEGLAGMKI